MSTTATRLRRVRRELDEIGESVERLAAAVEHEPASAIPPLVSLTEIAEITGIKPSTLRTMRVRTQLPTPIAELAVGPIWLKSDIKRWAAKR